ncbi:hypothetical protein CLV62_101488 [Dysgonomonas alginatilytica]|uniref:Uncharacterized protein n=1 Tax=Dysgonomonas alginatilytica TaxID=1605892 RepID=A0A2V3PUC2_9BACT|nr:hypothetical protein [Dysgonomonas alginatilytica]PXV69219.1 hypothetical protein CLV62_101488 [Dysgonomonas alginatilytica]
MKTDLYTKTVLTVIAVFLGVLIFQNTSVISTVQANTAATSPTPIPTAIQNTPVDVNIVQVDGKPVLVEGFNGKNALRVSQNQY